MIPDLVVAGPAEGADGQTNGAAVVSGEVITAEVVVDALPTAISSRNRLGEYGIYRALANALLAHCTEVTNPKMVVPGIEGKFSMLV